MRSSLSPLLGLVLTLGAACAAPPRAAHDVHSRARPDEVRVTHVSLDLVLDFDAHQVRGAATLDLDRADPRAPLVLDVDGLHVGRVVGADGSAREFRLGPAGPLGAALTVELAPSDSEVRVVYHTQGDTEALQWLAPEQTAGGRHPFLFTQGQSILTRSWIPLQDSPGVRVTYDARIAAPEGLVPVMSAQALGRDPDGAYRFALDRPIPPYLVALACGDLVFEPISERCGVWAEPEVAAPAARELEDTEAMIQAAERLFGPYRWGRYDVLVLPPAFPFGGMENPLLTFATPTILAGDKSLVALIAHELAHSWSGNLVTNATWRDFWLNEGFTVYLEKRIMEEVFGPERAAMEKVLDLADLEAEMEELDDWAEVLHVDLGGRHPDEAFSSVPYEKGALFLRRLEELAGRERFDAFLSGWFDDHAFQSVTTGEFRAYLERELLADLDERPDLDLWLAGPGLPPDAPRPSSTAFEEVEREVDRWEAGTPAGDLATEGWVTAQWLHFLGSLPAELDPARMAELDAAFGFTASGNSEVLCAWLRLAVRHGYRAADERLERFLLTVGRRKFLTPLYTELASTEAGLARARELYLRARPGYHAVSRGTMDEVLGWEAFRAKLERGHRE